MHLTEYWGANSSGVRKLPRSRPSPPQGTVQRFPVRQQTENTKKSVKVSAPLELYIFFPLKRAARSTLKQSLDLGERLGGGPLTRSQRLQEKLSFRRVGRIILFPPIFVDLIKVL